MKFRHEFAAALFVLTVGGPAWAAQWQIIPSPSMGSQANSLSSVSAAADNDVWAVGWWWNNNVSAYRTLIEHWNGAAWSIVASPNTTTGYNLLNDVAVVSANDVWTVGQAAQGATYKTLIEHWNGSAWAVVASPNVAGESCLLSAVAAVSAADIWAVGSCSDASFNNHALAMHWNGGAWSIVTTPSVNDDMLLDVAGVSSTDVWAVGRSQQEARTLTMHWDGGEWLVVASPDDGAEDNVLHGVAAVASDDVWAVGSASSQKSLALHWDGISWSVVPTPGLTGNNNNPVLVGVVALASDDVWAAGQFLISSAIQQTLTEHWDGAAWAIVRSPNRRNSNNRLSDIALTPSGVLWAVGTTGVFGSPERTFILRRNP